MSSAARSVVVVRTLFYVAPIADVCFLVYVYIGSWVDGCWSFSWFFTFVVLMGVFFHTSLNK